MKLNWGLRGLIRKIRVSLSRFSFQVVWSVFFFVLIFLAALVLLFDVYVFMVYGSGWQKELPQARGHATEPSEKLLESVRLYLREREVLYEELRENTPAIKNPFFSQ
ncbi:MAG: hypothetical protein A3C80_03175 [Candidatus Ryanbacteria bacterium RIFCSPHIGHO2_02_FULL_45_43]|uniref:Uncharacterized protein n=1 Tax=Candidatus Ryanbacteria bacterium RIFCSPHIGHO2_01_45_13 TaxID=1802112 RepID=A0A1G2G0P1_9BACT|nr:MAG: hypothetical protein A2718_04130 [Candidatus Ryanbacteria bacterium RIFCSPHIGHO2_01_FULL_44_130]OGZ43391.1 MAG: hypothetical protein A2W41_03965 [Candidatus Ryanbacteria bacterium RIFCSPHIGHO2_01_45_13]OGZ48976.1 MAG: hypothetical protein A3C80_03175 [Candidatus Ryanbacteria bacterium RIFCSPHIGHO2_02_FULL_45_43]OGZ50977.1 MAG: hypothetical protein A3E55_04445 [Candidatus Ryanbacteria bacterium RIFCSPHIGHO2_12_FULL_44_20]OGZ51582.1 MAG: hypothetical protein A3A17_02110 [Candidatus Ryanba